MTRSRPSSSVAALDVLLVDACRIALDLSPSSEALPDDVDLDLLLETSDAHGLTPYLFECLERKGAFERVDAGVRDIWQKAADLYASRYFYRKSQWAEARRIFRDTGCDFIPIKGAAFAFDLFKRPYRDMNDFDLLIRESDLPKAQARLERAGIEPVAEPSRFAWHQALHLAQLRATPPALGRCGYGGNDLPIDLHWQLSYPVATIPLELDAGELWNEAKPAGAGQWELSPRHQFVLVLAHAAASWPPRLTHWVDTVLLAKGLDSAGNVRDLLMTGTALRTSAEGRSLLCERIEAVWRIFHSGLAEPLPQWLPSVCEPASDPTLGEWQDHRRARMAFLSPRERLQFLLGFCFPSRRYYERERTGSAVVSFYGATCRSLLRMGSRVVRAFKGKT